MTLARARVAVFAALRDLDVGFVPGLNLVVGENEAGKSTLYAAIRHMLLTPTRLTRGRFDRELGRYLPRPDGNELEGELTIWADRSPSRVVVFRKRWGGDPRSVLTLPDGTAVSGEEAESRVTAMLPVRAGTWATLFLIGQAELDATLERLVAAQESRDEVTGVLRRAQEETGGVLVEAFERELAARSARLFSRWDRERDRPEGGRGIERPWSKGVGELLRVWYARERTRRELEETLGAEQALEEAGAVLAAAQERLGSIEEFVDRHRNALDSLRRSSALRTQIDAQADALENLRAAVRRWPVLLEELRLADERLAAAAREVEAGEAGLSRAAERRTRAARRERYERALGARREADRIREQLASIAPLDETAVKELRAAEGLCAELRARLSVGTIRLGVTFTDHTVVDILRDDEPPVPAEAAAGRRLEAEAHRRIEIRAESVRLEAESGDEPYDDLHSHLEQARRERETIAAALGVESAEEAAERRRERAALERELAGAERRCGEVLADEPFETLREEFAAAGGSADAGGSGDDEGPDESALVRTVADATGDLRAAEADKRNLEQEHRQLAERYGTQDALEDRLVEARSRLSALERERDEGVEVPDGFETPEQFLAAYEEREASLASLRTQHREASEAQTDLLARQPERTAEEVRAALHEAEREYERVRRRAEAVERLEAAVAAERAAQHADPFEPFARLVSRYLSTASDREYAVIGPGGSPDAPPDSPPDSPLVPGRFARTGGPELAYELLSQGTRDIVALALRLALAETALGGADAPLLLDDPLVDMDPRRREAAARAVAAYAGSRQVLLFTCHPEHAALFGGAHRVDLGSRRGHAAD